MKQFLPILFLLVFYVPFHAEAHQIKTDHGITVLLHVDPSDEPLSGTTTRMYLAFSSKTVVFKPGDCNCFIYVAPYEKLDTIKEEGVRIDVASMEKILSSSSFTYTFPRHDIYAVVLEGSPKENATFEPFRIVYDLRVARGEEIVTEKRKTSVQSVVIHPYVHIGSVLLLALAVLGGLYRYFTRCEIRPK